MKNISLITFIAMSLLLSFVSCNNDNDDIDYGRICITNETAYNWHNATIQFKDENEENTKQKNIGTVEINHYVYVNKLDEYFVVQFTDDDGIERESEKYFSNPYVTVKYMGQGGYKDRICITNKTSYNWHDAIVQFKDINGANTKYWEIGTLEKNRYVYVGKYDEYLIVYFTDDDGKQHESAKYYANPYVDILTLNY